MDASHVCLSVDLTEYLMTMVKTCIGVLILESVSLRLWYHLFIARILFVSAEDRKFTKYFLHEGVAHSTTTFLHIVIIACKLFVSYCSWPLKHKSKGDLFPIYRYI